MLITIEGIDGSGKSSLIRELKPLLKDAIFTQEPYGVMKQNVENFNGRINKNYVYSFLSHAEHLEKLIEPKKDDNIIVSERFFDSIAAYQAEVQAIDINRFIKYQEKNSVIPDITILLTCDIDVAYERSGENIFDSKIFMKNVQDNYKILAAMNPERFIVFDTTNIEIHIYKYFAENIVFQFLT